MWSSLRNHNLSARLGQPADELWDRYLGVSTFGFHPGTGGPGDREWYMHYIPSPYRDIFDVFNAAGLNADDTVTDLGCGLGRAVFAAAHMGAGRVEGVELVESLAQQARINHQKGRLRKKKVEIIAANAIDHDLSATTVCYIFHSFGHHIMGEVLERAREDRRRAAATAPLRIAYINPVCNDVIEASGWFRRVRDLPARSQFLSNADHYAATVWVSSGV